MDPETTENPPQQQPRNQYRLGQRHHPAVNYQLAAADGALAITVVGVAVAGSRSDFDSDTFVATSE